MYREGVNLTITLMAVFATTWPASPIKAEALSTWASSTLSAVRAWEGCWKKVPIAAGTSVDLRLLDDTAGLKYHVREDVEVLPITGDKAPANTVVKLQEAKGRIALDKVAATDSTKVYLIVAGDGIQLNAQQDTRLKLKKELPKSSEGKFVLSVDSSGSPLDIVLDTNEALPTEVAADGTLLPVPVDDGNAWLRAGLFPVVSGGKSVEASFHAPGVTASDLTGRAFQACIIYDDSGEKVVRTGVDVIAPHDGVATLAIWIPDSLGQGYNWLWQRINLSVLDTTTGLVAGPVSAYVGNPLISAVIAVVLTAIVILVMGRLIGQTSRPIVAGDGGAQSRWRWAFSLIDEGGGRKSLALFQIAAWTLLVLAGMFYVLAMSGNLLNVSEEMLVLLGLAGVAVVASRWVNPAPDKPSDKGFASMFFVGDQPDLTRLQMFLFTLLIWVYVAWRIVTEQAFPALGANVLLLMGISSGVYVTAKWAQTAGSGQDMLAGARRLRLTVDTLNEAVAIKQQEIETHDRTVKATQDVDGKPLAGKEEENRKAREGLQRAQGDLTKLQADLAKAKTDWTTELDSLKTK